MDPGATAGRPHVLEVRPSPAPSSDHVSGNAHDQQVSASRCSSLTHGGGANGCGCRSAAGGAGCPGRCARLPRAGRWCLRPAAVCLRGTGERGDGSLVHGGGEGSGGCTVGVSLGWSAGGSMEFLVFFPAGGPRPCPFGPALARAVESTAASSAEGCPAPLLPAALAEESGAGCTSTGAGSPPGAAFGCSCRQPDGRTERHKRQAGMQSRQQASRKTKKQTSRQTDTERERDRE